MQTQEDILTFIIITTFLLLLMIGFIVIILFMYQKKQQYFTREIELIKMGFDKELLKTQLEIQEETFEHISLELHDNVGHIISLAKLHLTTLNTGLSEQTSKNLDESISLLGASLHEIRSISRSLNTENIRNNGLIETIRQQIIQIEKTGKFTIDLKISGKTCFMDDQKELVLFRIFQEAVNNIFKHSQADKITINMQYNETEMTLKISDNGIGFDVNETTNIHSSNTSGLKNIIKRSCLINASHKIISIPSVGTIIDITTPY